MTVKDYNAIEDFLDDNQSFLENDEAANNLLLGIPLSLKSQTVIDPAPIMLSVFRGGKVVFSCLQTPPLNLILYGREGSCSEELETLISFLLKNGYDFPGVLGPRKIAREFSDIWKSQKGDNWETVFEHLVFQLNKVEDIPISNGKLRKANESDFTIVAKWFREFIVEATHDDPSNSEKLARNKLDDGLIYLWEDGEIVSIAAVARPTTNGITVNYVYTPKEYRGKGYASSIVARMSELMLERYKFCALFTDLANPTSNKIYKAIGYIPVQEFTQIKFIR